jgi:hypothetical protein
MPCIWGQHNGSQLFCPVVILPPNNAPPIGIMPIQGVGGVQHHNSHLFLVSFPFALPAAALSDQPPPQQGMVPGQLFILQKVIQGCAFQGGNAPFQVLLGMDVISTGSLVVQGNGTFSFSF